MRLIVLILFLLANTGWAQSGGFALSSIQVTCKETELCKQRRQRLENLEGEYRSLVHLKDTLRIMASDGGYKSFTYELWEDNGKYGLKINLVMKPVIEEISVGTIDRNIEMDLTQLFSLKEGQFYEPLELTENIDGIQKRIEAMGFPSNQHQFEVIEKDDKIFIQVAITLGEPRIFKKIKTDTKSTFINEFLIKKFFNLYNKPFDFNRFKIYLDDAQKELFNYGYYLINLDFVPILSKDRVILDIKVTNDDLYTFDLKGMKRETRDSLLSVMTGLFKQYKRPLTKAIIRQALQDHYRKVAIISVDVDSVTGTFRNKFKEEVHLYRIKIDEGGKTRVKKINFSGNTHYSTDKLNKFYYKEAFELASLNFYDPEYLEYFAGYLRNRYLKNGYVQFKIDGPLVSFDADKKIATVDFNIHEGKQAFVKKINFTGLPNEFENEMAKALKNKEGSPFNPIAMVEDIKKVANLLQESGYYFAEVTNANDEDIALYSKSGTEVELNFIVNAGQIVRLNRVLFLGNDKTRKKVLNKKIFLEEGELITPSKTREIESAISATGLFNTVSVMPVKHTSKRTATDLIVKVTERDYGLAEMAPGFRTDIGIKLTGTIAYQNIGGLNRSLTFKGQVNQRINGNTLDPERRAQDTKLLEYNFSLLYNQGDIFDSSIDWGLGGTYQRKRFYSFDADIFRVNSTLTRDITKRLSASLRYQWENITQWDATSEQDNGNFKIGAVTPSLTYDLRNSQVNPSKGAFFNLSTEFANPYFLSQNTDDLVINYYKTVSRNRFYIPFKNGTVAIAMIGGVEQNLAREKQVNDAGQTVTTGYIPSIKVFRMAGMDIVRGYSDQELNAQPNGEDITSVKIDNRAYLALFKFEPRYFFNDNFIGGVFYDAGSVFVNKVNLGELKDSVGISFKILTPVGTLDFDYGIKLLRKTNPDGSLEDPGRFHVSIGFF